MWLGGQGGAAICVALEMRGLSGEAHAVAASMLQQLRGRTLSRGARSYPHLQATRAHPAARRPQAAAQQIAAGWQAGRARAPSSPRRKSSIHSHWPAAALWRAAAICRAASTAAGPAAICSPAAVCRPSAAAGAAAVRPAAARPAALWWPSALWPATRRAAALCWPAICRARPRPGALVDVTFAPLVRSHPTPIVPLWRCCTLACPLSRHAILHAGVARTVTVNTVACRAGTEGCCGQSVGARDGRAVPAVACRSVTALCKQAPAGCRSGELYKRAGAQSGGRYPALVSPLGRRGMHKKEALRWWARVGGR